MDAARLVLGQVGKLTQAGLAAAASVTQARISQIAQDFGGWANFKKLLVSLVEHLYSETYNFEKLDPELAFMAEMYLPLALDDDPGGAISTVAGVLKSTGWKVFEAVLASMPPGARVKLLAVVVSLLPSDLQSEFLAISGVLT